MSKQQYAIEVRDVKKSFYLPHHKNDQLKSVITQLFKKRDNSSDVFNALNGISFTINKGEFFGILGRNGSGKSTLLKIISDIYRPTSGTVSHRGTLVSFIELGVGFKSELTGRENVYLNGAMLGFSKREIDDRYDEIVEFAELKEFMNQKIKNYSSGMKVRLAFAVAIQAKSDILVLDEVLAVGDASFQRKCYEYFRSLKKDKAKTIVFVTHSMSAVKEYCDKAILIEGGKIVEEGDAEKVADAYTQMFNKDRKSPVSKSAERWGSGEAKFTTVISDITKEKLILEVGTKGLSDGLEDLTIGVNILDDKGRLVTGVIKDIQRKHIFALNDGEERTFKYSFDNFFGGGDYSVILSLKSQDGSYIYDFWNNATSFVNKFETDEYFPTLIPVKIDSSK